MVSFEEEEQFTEQVKWFENENYYINYEIIHN